MSTCLVVVSLLFAVVAREGLEGLVLGGLLARVVALEGLGGLLARVVVLGEGGTSGTGGTSGSISVGGAILEFLGITLIIISGLFSSSVDVSQFSDSLAAGLVGLWFCLLRSCRRDTVRAGSVRGFSTGNYSYKEAAGFYATLLSSYHWFLL